MRSHQVYPYAPPIVPYLLTIHLRNAGLEAKAEAVEQAYLQIETLRFVSFTCNLEKSLFTSLPWYIL